ncbi:uncharacterized membrane protein YheB (UPF0754 family) [Oikeobacillus pervagus]|uniref:Uncharacterized membrane protein YheB (UPF0754 family) n=1 Tax=Oikeobacillus pervagus TaxID=1325931 RepID=A0AAJ1SYB3_9BACI|nr:DUF445 family protein [Oikeobacillus pervagus]MDQ0214739.1 uncharacterized membrane protein YheB (UPF0754 family) [Oikeobacillus pervagus]
MDPFFLFLFMVIVGAVIGGMTNSIAIQMLFRPYKAFYIGKWRMPFTPGLIPKRRGELAEQLGKIVSTHLLTPESIQNKFQDEQFQKEMTQLVQAEITRFFSSKKTVAEWLQYVQIQEPEQKTIEWVDKWLDGEYHNLKRTLSSKTLGSTLPKEWKQKVDEKIPDVTDYILQKAVDYFSSEDGNQLIKKMIDEFFMGRGKLGNMLQMFLGNTSLADKIQPEIIKFLKSDGTKELLNSLLKKEWEEFSHRDWNWIFAQISEEALVRKGKEWIIQRLPVQKVFQRSLGEILMPYKNKIVEEVTPKLVVKSGTYLASRVQTIMEKLHISKIVKEQVESFSVKRLEQMVLEISRKELKMITFLGALLGGIIGGIQSIIVMVL